MTRFRPVLEGLRLAPGALRLVALRMIVVALASAPALVAGLAGIAMGAGRRPYYTEVGERLPMARFLRLLRDVPEGYIAALIVSIALAILADQVLTGGAVAVLSPEGSPRATPAGRGRVFATVCREGLVHLWAFLRVVALGLVIAAAGIALLRLPFKRLGDVADRSGWSGETTLVTLPFLSVLAGVLWVAMTGAWALWCRLITAADRRRRVRRTALLALRVLLRFPLRAGGLFVVLTVTANLASGAVLVAWRQAEPVRGAGMIFWPGVWLAMLALQSFVWVYLLRVGTLMYASDRLGDLRGAPDAPLGVGARLRRWLRLGAPERGEPGAPPRPPAAPGAAGDAPDGAGPARAAPGEDRGAA
jgi:hypothetical protein